MKLLFILSVSTVFCLPLQAQNNESIKKAVDSINRLLDRSVVQKRLHILKKHYADDFVFTHGTGLIDSKESWIKNVADTSVHFVSREHDSVNVELHGDIAILNGKLTVHRQRPAKVDAYALRYVRVYAKRKNIWQLISHRTTHEWHMQ